MWKPSPLLGGVQGWVTAHCWIHFDLICSKSVLPLYYPFILFCSFLGRVREASRPTAKDQTGLAFVANSWHILLPMAFALAKENEAFIKRMISGGRFGNQSEIVREALRRMEREEMAYLNPPPMTEKQARQAFAPDREWEKLEGAAVRKTKAALRRVKRWEDL